jgi:hypothetical protein
VQEATVNAEHEVLAVHDGVLFFGNHKGIFRSAAQGHLISSLNAVIVIYLNYIILDYLMTLIPK